MNNEETTYNTNNSLPLGGSGWESIYFIGIGGIGMSAIARYFVANGKTVAGYDRTPSPITDMLLEQGVEIHFEDAVENIPSSFLDKEKTLVVYTPAIPKEHKELNYFIDNGFEVVKRAKVLGLISEPTFCFAVAGTHGKTTTTAILGYLLTESNLNATTFLGGIAENYRSNFIYGGDEISVVEADEFDKSFLHLSPNVACITSVDADHLDIYGNHNEMKETFGEFAKSVSQKLIVRKGLEIKGITYGLEGENADYEAVNLRIENGSYIFDIAAPTEIVKDFQIHLAGKHNVLNALVASIMANSYGVPFEKIKKLLLDFKGIERRFSYRIKEKNKILIDDYAHHPSEIKAVALATKEMYPDKKITAVFQPHLYSRTRDFADDFAKELSKFDAVILLDIYPARELPIEGITSEWLLSKMDKEEKYLSSKENLFETIQKTKAEVVLMLGAGDIGMCVETIKTKWNER